MTRQLTVFACLAIFIFTGIAATHLPQQRNLKVLPQDISDRALDSIMDSYTRALNVNCGFCHAQDKANINNLNFESDENPVKDQARRMMRLTIGINKDYFYFDSTKRPEFLNVVSCLTCHRGNPMPVDLK